MGAYATSPSISAALRARSRTIEVAPRKTLRRPSERDLPGMISRMISSYWLFGFGSRVAFRGMESSALPQEISRLSDGKTSIGSVRWKAVDGSGKVRGRVDSTR
jgi:hypothetical protein